MPQFNARERKRIEAIQRRIDYIRDQEELKGRLNDYEKAELSALIWALEQVHNLADRLEACQAVVAGQRTVITELKSGKK